MDNYGYSSRNHQMTGYDYGRSSAGSHRVHPEPTATRQTSGHHYPSYSLNMTGWQSADNTRQTSYNRRNHSDVISDKSVSMSECHSVDYCEVCCCAINGPKAFDCHINGSRHKKNLKNRAEGRPIKKARSKSSSLQCEPSLLAAGHAQIMPILNNTREALIGLQFVTEYQKSDIKSEPHYVCQLCDTTCDPRILLPHLIGFKHRMNFMYRCRTKKQDVYRHLGHHVLLQIVFCGACLKEHYPSYYATIKQTYQKKSEQIPLAEEYARKIECEEGRKEVKVISEASEFSEEFSKPAADGGPDTTLHTSGKRKARDIESTTKRCCGPCILGDPETKSPYSIGSSEFMSNQDQSTSSSYICEPPHAGGYEQELVEDNRIGTPASSEPDFKTDNNPDCTNVRWQNNDKYRLASSRDSQRQDKNGDRSWSTAGCHGSNDNTWNSNQVDWTDLHQKRNSELRHDCSTHDLGDAEKGQSSNDFRVRSAGQGQQTSSGIGRFLEEMANCVVKSEEDAEMALHVSNTLTKALMDYRMKDLSRKLESRAMKRTEEPTQEQADTQ